MSMMWKKFPPKTILAQILQPGGAFRVWYSFGNEPPKHRYFFVLNHSPNTAETLLVSTSTTQVGKRFKFKCGDAINDLVVISPSEYTSFTQLSAIDCASVIDKDQTELVRQVGRLEIEPLPKLPLEVLERIYKAVKSTKTLSMHQKRLILPPEDEM